MITTLRRHHRFAYSMLSLILCCLVGCSNVTPQDSVRSPLITKYLSQGQPEVRVFNQHGKLYAIIGYRAAMKFSFDSSLVADGDAKRIECPEIDKLLRMKRIKVADSLGALNIKSLWDLLAGRDYSGEYLAEDVTKSNGVWTITSRFFGSPDDGHRRSRLIIHELDVDNNDFLTTVRVRYLDY